MPFFRSDSITIPPRLESCYENENIVKEWITSLSSNIESFIPNGPQQQFFFPEFTNHGIFHINEVLFKADQLIPDSTLKKLRPYDLFYLISAIMIHDIGMHITPILFSRLINGSNDQILKETGQLDNNRSWKELLTVFLTEVNGYPKNDLIKNFNSEQLSFDSANIEKFLGNINDYWRPQDTTTLSLIGEFMRRNHHRYCHEVMILGCFNVGEERLISLITEPKQHRPGMQDLRLIGVLARSHCHDLPCKKIDNYIADLGMNPETPAHNIHIKYLMAVLRIADYISIDAERTGIRDNNVFYNQRSYFEHLKHKKICRIDLKYIKERKIEIMVDEISPQDIGGVLNHYKANYKDLDDQLDVEIKELIGNIQLELNASSRTISKINQKCGDHIYDMIIDEIDWLKLRYFKKNATNKEPAESSSEGKQFKIRPYKYYGFNIEKYLEKAGQLNRSIDLWIEDSSEELSKLYTPLGLKLLNVDRTQSAANLPQLADKNQPTSNIEGSTAVSISDRNDFYSDNQKLWNEIFTPSDLAVGIIADLGYGKTILCRSLLHFFVLRATHDLHHEKLFWEDLYYLPDINFIPILYTCKPLEKEYTSVAEFIKDAIQPFDLGHEVHEKVCTELEDIFYSPSGKKLLFIVDAVDELVDKPGSQYQKLFMDFLIQKIASNDDHALVFTRRRGRFEINKPIIRYGIEGMNAAQQKKIVEKLAASQQIVHKKDIESFIEILGKVGPEFSGSPFNLTNFFLYYIYNNQEVPSPFELEKHRVELYFRRKKMPYSPLILELLKTVAEKIRQNPPYISKSDLMDHINAKIKEEKMIQQNYGNSEKLLSVLSDNVGILKIDALEKRSFTDEPRFYFSNKKIYENLLFYVDSEKLSTDDLQEMILSDLNKDGDNPEFYSKYADLIYITGFNSEAKK